MSLSNILNQKLGASVVLAGAGTGKTYTIIEKVKDLIKNKFCKPSELVCITFSNEAATSLQIRLQRQISVMPVVQTFHAFAAELLRNHGSIIGVKDNFSILVPDEAKVLLHRMLRLTAQQCHKYISAIGMAKDMGIKLEDIQSYLANHQLANNSNVNKELEELQFTLQTLHLKQDKPKKADLQRKLDKLSHFVELTKFSKAWQSYEKIKNKQNCYDYSDLALKVLELFAVKKELSKFYKYVIVDEFQDTNKIQLDFLFALQPEGNIMVVGDMNQSIYRFRGAHKANFQLFKDFYKITGNQVYTLQKSHRCPNAIGRLAYELIKNNYENKEDCFIVENANNVAGEPVKIIELENAYEEARKVVEIINLEVSNGVQLEDICIMFRTHQQSRIIRKVLEQNKILYSAATEKSLLQIPVIKIVLDYANILDLLSGNKKGGEQAWWDLLYRLHFNESDLVILGKEIKLHRDEECLSSYLLSGLINLNLSNSGKKIATGLIEKLNYLKSFTGKSVKELFEEIYKTSGLIGGDIEDPEIVLALQALTEVAEQNTALYGSELSSFMSYLETLRQLGIELPAPTRVKPGVKLMTLHATKGLEYKVVILTNFAQKRFPLEEVRLNSLLPYELLPEFTHLKDYDLESKEEAVREYERENLLLEERRLCYVAFTRTKERMYITYSLEYAGKKVSPSQFLHEINYMQNSDCQFIKDSEVKYKQPEAIITDGQSFSRILSGEKFENDLKSVIKNNHRIFSPSALLLFDECQKKYEYKYVYQMPDEKTISWESMQQGSFVHLVLEYGVKNNFKTLEEFIDYSKVLHSQEEWKSLDLNEIEPMLKVFFERNKGKYSDKSLTEQHLHTKIRGFSFTGFADRIDFRDEGIAIVDYKTGKQAINPKHRAWQLGYYAIAAKSIGDVKWLVLDMLRQEKPLEFKIDDSGKAQAVYASYSFSIPEVEKELVETAESIMKAYDSGFKACKVEKNCEFCNQYIHGL